MSYQIIKVDDAEGTVTYELDYGSGVLQEVILVRDYPTEELILARIAERETLVCEEVLRRRAVEIPAGIRKMAQARSSADEAVSADIKG